MTQPLNRQTVGFGIDMRGVDQRRVEMSAMGARKFRLLYWTYSDPLPVCYPAYPFFVESANV
jgi:hypothetical protein